MKNKTPFLFVWVGILSLQTLCAAETNSGPVDRNAVLRLSTLDMDVTPPIGSHMAYDPVTNGWDLGLRARGIVLQGAGQPIVLCAVDWIGIANEGYDAFRNTLAEAVGTIPNRVAVHTLHQHDAPECDLGAERLLQRAGLGPRNFKSAFAREVLRRLNAAARQSLERSQPITHVGLGQAPVYQVASNRRLLGTDGRVRATRFTSCQDPALRAEPEGTIDPIVSLISFWSTNRPVAVLSYYAVHPQSYYRTGVPNPDFPGVARFFRQLAVPAALHIHFNGAGGNLGAGKYNDGSPENRLLLAERLAEGMKRAWEATQREPISTDQIAWTVEPVALPPAKSLEKLKERLDNKDYTALSGGGALKLEWLRRCQAGYRLDITCLALGPVRVLHLPGELFVEFQLAAKAARPDLFVAVAAYGDYGPGYICTAIAYEQGGYEASPGASNVEPAAENILLTAIHKLLKDQPK